MIGSIRAEGKPTYHEDDMALTLVHYADEIIQPGQKICEYAKRSVHLAQQCQPTSRSCVYTCGKPLLDFVLAYPGYRTRSQPLHQSDHWEPVRYIYAAEKLHIFGSRPIMKPLAEKMMNSRVCRNLSTPVNTNTYSVEPSLT